MYFNKTSINKYLYETSCGNKEAFTDLYYEIKAPLYGFILSIVKNAQDAEDILQETFIKVYNLADTYEAKGSPLAWIYKIAQNESLMKLRKRKKEVDLSDDWESMIPSPEGIDNLDKLFLQELLKKLDDEERMIIVMHISGGFKHREIATFLDKTLTNVLTKYHRALKKLKKLEDK